MENTTRVSVRVDRPEAIRRGINGTDEIVQIDVDVSTLSQQDRDEFASRLRSPSNLVQDFRAHVPRAYIHLKGERGERYGGYPIVVNDPSQEGLVEAFARERQAVVEYEAEQERLAQERAEAEEAAIQAWLAKPDEELLRQLQYHGDHRGHRYLRWGTVYVGGLSRDDPRYVAREAELQAEADRRNQQLRDEIDRQIADEKAKVAAWIKEHGSDRLQVMLAEGIECEATYQQERQARDDAVFTSRLDRSLPGWYEIDPGSLSEPANVPDSAIAVLRAGREIISDCRLAFSDDIDWYIVVAEFEGRTIAWPAE